MRGSKRLAAPTDEESQRIGLLKAAGCVCCALPAGPCEAHHLLRGGVRLGHLYTVGLCPWHHRGVPDADGKVEAATMNYGPSLFHDKRRFYDTYGDDQHLLDLTNERIGWPRIILPESKIYRFRG